MTTTKSEPELLGLCYELFLDLVRPFLSRFGTDRDKHRSQGTGRSAAGRQGRQHGEMLTLTLQTSCCNDNLMIMDDAQMMDSVLYYHILFDPI